MIYTATHHGNRPFIGGPPADKELFKQFIQAADVKGIDVQFFTSLADAAEYDIPFIQSLQKSTSWTPLTTLDNTALVW